MAEAFARQVGGEAWIAASAGVEAKSLNQVAVNLMAEVGIDMSGHVPRQVTTEEMAVSDLVVTLCDKTRGGCPIVPPGVRHVSLMISDPGRLDPQKPEDLSQLRQLRDQIRASVASLL